MGRRNICWGILACILSSLSGTLYARGQLPCVAANMRFNPTLAGALTWSGNAWGYMGTSTLNFDCTTGMQSRCGACVRTKALDANGVAVGNPVYNSFFWYTCGTSPALNLQTTFGPLVTGKSYVIQLDAWSLAPFNSQCPLPAGTAPAATTSDVITEVPPPPK